MREPIDPHLEHSTYRAAAAYRAPLWLRGCHAQTIWPLCLQAPLPTYRRERWETPDGDFIDLDWLPVQPGKPLVVLFHGLEGSSDSHSCRGIMGALAVQGWNGVVPHFRGCSGEPNRLARAYHSGDSAEIGWILERLAALGWHGGIYAAGISLGGNALLKWLGERGHDAGRQVLAAAAICPPLDLTISGHALGRGLNLIYTRHFLSTLKRKALAKIARGMGDFDVAAIRRAATLYQFDDAYTAPLHGFAGADDYWSRASARPWLRAVRIPTLLVCSDNDPFVPPPAWPEPAQLSPALSFEVTSGGGHVGFAAGRFPGRLEWLGTRLVTYFAGREAAFRCFNSATPSARALG